MNSEDNLHRIDGPAIIRKNGDKEWYLYGLRHREDGPAYEGVSGYTAWWVNGQRHRVGKPAIENGARTEWYLNGKRHREDGPAIEDSRYNKEMMWYRNGRLHRIDGAAYVYYGFATYHIDGVELSFIEFCNHEDVTFEVVENLICEF